MTIIFGTKACAACQQKIKEFKKKKIKYEYYDIETVTGLAVAAYYQVLGSKKLPIIINTDDKNEG